MSIDFEKFFVKKPRSKTYALAFAHQLGAVGIFFCKEKLCLQILTAYTIILSVSRDAREFYNGIGNTAELMRFEICSGFTVTQED